jgi:hypothetical protein
MSDYAYIDASAHVFAPWPESAKTNAEARELIKASLTSAPAIRGSEYALDLNVKITHNKECGWCIRVYPSGIMRDRRRKDAVVQWKALLEFLGRTFGSEPVVDHICITENYDVWFKAMKRHNKGNRNGEN